MKTFKVEANINGTMTFEVKAKNQADYIRCDNPDTNFLEIKITGNNQQLSGRLSWALKETIGIYIKDRNEMSK